MSCANKGVKLMSENYFLRFWWKGTLNFYGWGFGAWNL